MLTCIISRRLDHAINRRLRRLCSHIFSESLGIYSCLTRARLKSYYCYPTHKPLPSTHTFHSIKDHFNKHGDNFVDWIRYL